MRRVVIHKAQETFGRLGYKARRKDPDKRFRKVIGTNDSDKRLGSVVRREIPVGSPEIRVCSSSREAVRRRVRIIV